MTPHEAEALEVDLFVGAGRPLLGLMVVCIKALPRLLLASAVLIGCIYGRAAVPVSHAPPATPVKAGSAAKQGPYGGSAR